MFKLYRGTSKDNVLPVLTLGIDVENQENNVNTANHATPKNLNLNTLRQALIDNLPDLEAGTTHYYELEKTSGSQQQKIAFQVQCDAKNNIIISFTNPEIALQQQLDEILRKENFKCKINQYRHPVDQLDSVNTKPLMNNIATIARSNDFDEYNFDTRTTKRQFLKDVLSAQSATTLNYIETVADKQYRGSERIVFQHIKECCDEIRTKRNNDFIEICRPIQTLFLPKDESATKLRESVHALNAAMDEIQKRDAKDVQSQGKTMSFYAMYQELGPKLDAAIAAAGAVQKQKHESGLAAVPFLRNIARPNTKDIDQTYYQLQSCKTQLAQKAAHEIAGVTPSLPLPPTPIMKI
jgi:hypothetical protein